MTWTRTGDGNLNRFARQGEEWRRDVEVPQTLLLQTGLTSRIQVKFFVRVTLGAKERGVLQLLPLLPARIFGPGEQGYVFRGGDSGEAQFEALVGDVVRYCVPWFQRFTSEEEVRRGFADGTFSPHLPVEGKALVFPRRSG